MWPHFSEAQTCHGEEEGEHELEKRDIFRVLLSVQGTVSALFLVGKT